MKTKKTKRSKIWYLAIMLFFALGWVAGGVMTNLMTPVVVDTPIVDSINVGGEAALEPVEVTEDIKEVAEKIEEIEDTMPEPVVVEKKEEVCVPDADGFKRCDWGPEYADFPYSIPERTSPKDWIKEHEIQMAPRSVTIQIQGAILAAFADTNSMDPVFDAGSNAIEIVPVSPNQVQVGDIVSYDTDFGTIVHRIIETGYDDDGWYAIFQGDNNPIPDPEKVRWERIRRVVVAVIY